MLGSAAKELLQQHHYTGNIRELRSILLRAMLFRQSQIIGIAEIEQAIQPQTELLSGTRGTDRDRFTEQQAEELLEKFQTQEINFWDTIYRPYTRQELTRDVVIKLIEKGRAEGATTMPKLAKLLCACDPTAESKEEKKVFYRFKNFLYKTVRID